MTYFIADPHFGHGNIIRHCGRPFRHVEEMDEAMLQAWNQTVGPQDTVYILGDLMFYCDDPEYYLRRLPGKKYLVTGNHDKTWMSKLEKQKPGILSQYFEEISPIMTIREDGRKLILCHYPMYTWEDRKEGSWHIYGHIHNAADITPVEHALNAGVEINGYRPVTLEELVENNRAFQRTLHDPIRDYLALARQRPELFAHSAEYPLEMDEECIREFSRTRNRPMGVVYSNLPFYQVVADLCRGERGLYSYARVIYPNSTNGAVAIPRMGEKYAVLRSFRHVPRIECLEFPRGFAEKGLSPEENIRKELMEEMGGVVSHICHLGQTRADTGLSAGCVDVYLAELSQAQPQIGHEGNRELLWLTEEELWQKIAAGEITDGFTLAALSLLRANDEK